MRKARHRTRIQEHIPFCHQLPAKEMAPGSRNHKEHHIPLLPPHLRNPAPKQRHRHLHCQQDAHPQKRKHNADIRRSD